MAEIKSRKKDKFEIFTKSPKGEINVQGSETSKHLKFYPTPMSSQSYKRLSIDSLEKCRDQALFDPNKINLNQINSNKAKEKNYTLVRVKT